MTHTHEAALLLDCSGIHLDSPRIQALRQRIAAGVDWSEILRLAIPHGLLPLIEANLSRHAADLVPPMTMAQLALFRHRVEMRNRAQLAELLRVVAMLREAGIRVLPFKGPLLALCAYGDLSLRESHDLDLWVHPSDQPAAGDILRAGGYLAAGHKKGTPYLLETDLGDRQTEFMNSGGSVLLEIQGQLQSWEFSFWPEFDEVWARREEVALEGGAVNSFAPEELLLTLAVHGSKHMWRRLSWVVDLAALLHANPGLDWDLTLRLAKKWRCRRRLLCSLALADSLYGLPLPASVRAECGSHAYARAFVAKIGSQIVEGAGERTIRSYFAELRHHARNADTARDGLRLAIAYLDRIWKADESVMVRSMPQNTLKLFRISRRILSAFGSPANRG